MIDKLNTSTRLVAGRVCPKCKKIISNEISLLFLEGIKQDQSKRYGSKICNECAKGII